MSAPPPLLPPLGGRRWVCVGRVEDLPSRGAWLKAPLSPAGVVIVRGEDDRLRAYHAVCPHRGYAFVEGDEGVAREGRLTCNYHGYSFGLDGAPCGPSEGLSPVRLGVAHGFVFVTLDEATPPLDEALGEVPPWLERAALGRLRRVRRVAYEVAARWTLVLENFQESLHFATVHPELERLTPSARAETWMPGAGERGPWLGGIMPIAEHAETVSASGSRGGRPFIVPPEDRRVVHDAMRFPNLLTSLQPDYLLTFVVYPVGQARTRVVACTYVDRDAPEASLDDVFDFWSRVYEEDRLACERQELGLASPGARPAAWSAVEEGAAAIAKLVSAETALGSPRFAGLFGQPYVDLSSLLDTSCFAELHREITGALTQLDARYTGGTLDWMGVCAPWVTAEGAYRDAMHAILAMSPEEFLDFLSVGDADPKSFDPDPARRGDYAFGDETEHPFTRAQELLLSRRFGVYFPWKVCVHLLENDRWDDKHSGEGKAFSDEARRLLPKTVAFVESLPFSEIGRVVLFGLEANDHAPMHRDSEPGKTLSIAQSISFEPARAVDPRPKGFTLATPDGSRVVEVEAPIYWFNDMDWHGVEGRPYFRYSIRVDGVYEPSFVERVRRHATRSR